MSTRHGGLAGQYRFNAPAGAVPALALRLSAWGQRISPHGDGLVRAQFSHWLFFDTIPVTHNSSTAARLANHDSVLTLGLRARF